MLEALSKFDKVAPVLHIGMVSKQLENLDAYLNTNLSGKQMMLLKSFATTLAEIKCPEKLEIKLTSIMCNISSYSNLQEEKENARRKKHVANLKMKARERFFNSIVNYEKGLVDQKKKYNVLNLNPLTLSSSIVLPTKSSKRSEESEKILVQTVHSNIKNKNKGQTFNPVKAGPAQCHSTVSKAHKNLKNEAFGNDTTSFDCRKVHPAFKPYDAPKKLDDSVFVRGSDDGPRGGCKKLSDSTNVKGPAVDYHFFPDFDALPEYMRRRASSVEESVEYIPNKVFQERKRAQQETARLADLPYGRNDYYDSHGGFPHYHEAAELGYSRERYCGWSDEYYAAERRQVHYEPDEFDFNVRLCVSEPIEKEAPFAYRRLNSLQDRTQMWNGHRLNKGITKEQAL